MPRISLGDVEINYYFDDFRNPWEDSKNSPVVLMHHGGHRNAKYWTGWVPTLARKHRVLRYDARGCGESGLSADGTIPTIDGLAGDALSLMDRLEIETVHWIGTLSGGLTGQMFAILYPERIKSLTLVNSPCSLTAYKAMPGVAGLLTDPAALEKLGMREWRKKTVGVSLDLSKADPKLVEWHINEAAKTPQHAAAGGIRVQSSTDMTERLAEIKAPTLIMLGDRSQIVNPDMLRLMQERIPNSRLCVFPDIADGIDVIMPEQCAGEALRFISEVGNLEGI